MERLSYEFELRCGPVVEVVLDEETPSAERCSVVWLGRAGSKQEGEVGLEAIYAVLQQWPHAYRKPKSI